MAELPSLGEHCSLHTCHQLDFLPFTCDNCKLVFCKLHYQAEKHGCQVSQENKVLKASTAPKSYKCSISECHGKELTPVVCDGCSRVFCLQHRHKVDHHCPADPPMPPVMPLTTKLTKEIQSQQMKKTVRKIGRKSEKTFAQVQLMKMKMKSLGDSSLPLDERLYLMVHLPKGNTEKTRSVFVSKYWSVGKGIDVVAELCNLVNSNNVSAAKKLRIFRLSDGELISPSLDKTFGNLLEQEELYNGNSVVMEYCDDFCAKLENIHDYM